VASSATEWAWANTRASNGSLIVLLAIADETDRKGKAEMSVAELARKARLSDRAVQLATPVLVSLGELAVDVRAADGGRNRYRLLLVDNGRTGEESAPVKYLHPEESAPLPTIIREKPQVRPGGEISSPLNISNDLDLGSVVSGRRSKPSRRKQPEQAARPDVERLCQHLADRIIANGCRPPSITQKWRDAARLLIDKDGMTEKQVHDAIDWSTRDHFWHRNILSMPKLREQYDKLRLAAMAEREKSQQPRNSHQPTEDDYAALISNWARPLDEMEARNDPRGNDRPGEVHRPRLPAAEDAARDGDRLV